MSGIGRALFPEPFRAAEDMAAAIRKVKEITPVPARRELDMVLRFPKTCDAEVTRGGELDACGKPAVAIALDPESYPNSAYPVCKHHARGRQMLRLSVLFSVLGVSSHD